MTDLRLSVSKVKTFDSCKKKFQYTYILKLPRKEYEFYAFGHLLHKTLELFHITLLNSLTTPLDKAMSDAFRSAKKEFAHKLQTEAIQEAFEILKQYLKIVSINKEHNLSTSILAAEKDFELKLADDIVLLGTIDRVQIDKDGVLHVADYKTTKNKKYLKEDFFQLLTYCFVLLSEDPSIEKIRASYILLRHNFEYMTQEFTKEQILETKEKYMEYANKITTEKEYQASPSNLCRYCDFLDICEEGRKQMKRFNGEVGW